MMFFLRIIQAPNSIKNLIYLWPVERSLQSTDQGERCLCCSFFCIAILFSKSIKKSQASFNARFPRYGAGGSMEFIMLVK